MRTTGALFVVAVGVLLLWMAATGRLNNLANAWAAIQGKATSAPGNASPTAAPAAGTGISPANLLAWLPPLGIPSWGTPPVIPVSGTVAV